MSSDDSDDSTAPYNELEAFDSIWQALRWTQIRKRVPVCFKKTLHNRYMLANLIYVFYATCLLVIDFHPTFAAPSGNDTEDESISPLDQPVLMNEDANRFYIGIAINVRQSLTSSLDHCSVGCSEYSDRLSLLVGMARTILARHHSHSRISQSHPSGTLSLVGDMVSQTGDAWWPLHDGRASDRNSCILR